MRFASKRCGLSWFAGASIAFAFALGPLQAQTATPTASLVDQLIGPDTRPDIDVAAVRQQVMDRVKSKADATALKRPPIAPQLLKLPRFNFEVAFDPDSTRVRPQSYQTIGRIADALADPKLLHHTFLVVYHTESTGRRELNLTLSQRRADSIREVLAGAFKISPKRLQALGLGEEQLQDSSRPASPANQRGQIMTVGEVVAPVPTAQPPSTQAKKASGAAKKRK